MGGGEKAIGRISDMWELFSTFFRIGLFTIGGGYAMIPLIEAKVVDEKKWIERDMVVLGFYDDKPDKQSFVFVDGFELVGKYTIETGRTLPVEFGKSIYYLQNVAARMDFSAASPCMTAGKSCNWKG